MDEITVAHNGVLFEAGWSRWEQPLDLHVPTLVIDTSERYVDDLSEILDFVRSG